MGDGDMAGGVFTWEPKRGQEAKLYTICFTVADKLAGENTYSDTRCYNINVPKCKYCVKAGDTLQYVGRAYGLDANWLRMYTLNSWNSGDMLALNGNPDSVNLENNNGKPVYVGLQYTTEKGDTLATVAGRVSSTVKKILSLNPDISADGEL